jgi:hypothetical protein
MKKKTISGSVNQYQKYGSADPDPYLNATSLERCIVLLNGMVASSFGKQGNYFGEAQVPALVLERSLLFILSKEEKCIVLMFRIKGSFCLS